MTINLKLVQLHFDRAAERYERFAYVQKKILGKALSDASRYIADDAALLDIGCGGGLLARSDTAIAKRWNITQLDLSLRMCRHAKMKGHATVQANAEQLPFADGSFAAAICLSTLQWLPRPPRAWGEMHQVLQPGGYAIVYTFGSHTLQELRKAFAGTGTPSVHDFITKDIFLRHASEAGFEAVEHSQNLHVDYFEDTASILHSLKAIGATYADAAARGLSGRARLEHMEDAYEALRQPDGLPLTWDVMRVVARKRL